jgi:ketosteroid isomerase-like protein
LPKQILFAVLGSGIAPGGDLGYVYGSTTVKGNKETYLHIWRKEGKDWKLALEMLRL